MSSGPNAFTLPKLQALVAKGEGPTVEFKKTTGEMKEAMQSLCAFLNGRGGVVVPRSIAATRGGGSPRRWIAAKGAVTGCAAPTWGCCRSPSPR